MIMTTFYLTTKFHTLTKLKQAQQLVSNINTTPQFTNEFDSSN